MNVLILAGTTEATALARRLEGHAHIKAVVSLAGRTTRPILSRLPTRIGGFGGSAGLAGYLRDTGVGALVDATHPFAASMSRNAIAAARETGVPLIRLTRPAWRPGEGDDWTLVPDLSAAADALGRFGRRVLVTTGRKALSPFERQPNKSYVIRTIDPPDPRPSLPDVTYLQARGPFDLASESALMDRYSIDVLVTKASGGNATRAKLDAARHRSIPVIMVDRPPDSEDVVVMDDPERVVDWLQDLALCDHGASGGICRGV